ncbi:MAG: hypothetical protein IH600_12290 [Bacteroidetes bacterium]|nr:hypothetical protein [Bacteroidota bacterium]
MKKNRITLYLLTGMLLVACNGEPSLEEQLAGAWKNGDGNLIRFEEGDKAAVGQEGLSGEGACRYEIRQDTVVVTMLPDGETDTYVVYRLRLEDDTLRISSLERHAPNSVSSLTLEQYAQQAGRPLYKLDFTRIKKKK